MLMSGIFLAAAALFGVTDLRGTVVDAMGAPVAGARVFVEAGLAAPLQEAAAGPDGAFYFEELGTGGTGVFAYAPGHAFGGIHLDIAVEEQLAPVTIRLGKPDTIEGKVVGGKDTPVAGAMVTRIALLGPEKVGIPLGKLKDMGFEVPTSTADGRLEIPNLPAGASVALKVTHPGFAVEAMDDVTVGARNLKIQLYLGVLVEGTVVSRSDAAPMASVPVVLRNAQPPHDSTLTQSGLDGRFSVRLKPGVYLYQSAASTLQSSGWSKLVLDGEAGTAHVRVPVGGVGTIRGEVKDARTGQPIAGARVSLSTNGNRAAVERTGPTGIYQFTAGAGENVVRLELAQGFQPPATGSAVKLSLKEGETVELPGMWLAPLPSYRVQAVDDAMNGLPGVLVRVLQPSQLGVRASGADGWLDLNVGSLPEGGAIIGLAESRDGKAGALFRLEAKDAEGARVQLLPLATVSGQITNSRGKPVAGAVVGGAFPGAGQETEPVQLWKTVSDTEGRFTWRGVLAGVPQVIVARVGTGELAQSAPFNLAPGETKTMEPLAVEGTARGESALGTPFAWEKLTLACGTAIAAGKPAIVVMADPAEALAVAEALANFLATVGGQATGAVVVARRPECPGTGAPIYLGKAPGTARTLVLDASGAVTLETFGLPPAFALE